MKQNITLSLEKETVKKGKVIAARKDTSVSRMLSDLLRSMVENDERYEAAKRSAMQLLKKGIHLGGKITWKREDLYER
jgi:plasmid stability protein